jgi:hypothetical protein
LSKRSDSVLPGTAGGGSGFILSHHPPWRGCCQTQLACEVSLMRIHRIAQLAGIALAVIDGLVAATAIHHNLTVATRNVRDFSVWGAPVINPWEPA